MFILIILKSCLTILKSSTSIQEQTVNISSNVKKANEYEKKDFFYYCLHIYFLQLFSLLIIKEYI